MAPISPREIPLDGDNFTARNTDSGCARSVRQVPSLLKGAPVIAVDERPVYALKTRPAVPASYEEAVDSARKLSTRLRERVPETESLRHLPAENVGDLRE